MYASHKFVRARHGVEAKAKALEIAMKRKEEYLGARVPRELKARVIARAGKLGIPVSILIRNVLEEAFTDKVALEGNNINSLKKNSPAPATASRFPMVFAWEDIRLNRIAKCTACSNKLEQGSKVILGITAPGEERIILCDICKELL